MVASPFLPASTNKHRAAGLATKPARRGWLPSRPDIAAGRAGALGRIQAVAGAGDVLDRQRAGGGRVGQEGRQRASVGSGRTVGGPVLGRQGLVGGGGTRGRVWEFRNAARDGSRCDPRPGPGPEPRSESAPSPRRRVRQCQGHRLALLRQRVFSRRDAGRDRRSRTLPTGQGIVVTLSYHAGPGFKPELLVVVGCG